jgi:hypothetical protein
MESELSHGYKKYLVSYAERNNSAMRRECNKEDVEIRIFVNYILIFDGCYL